MLFGGREILSMFVSKRPGTNVSEEETAEEQRIWKEQNDEHCLKAETCSSVKTEEM